jgi:hypothetical protein
LAAQFAHLPAEAGRFDAQLGDQLGRGDELAGVEVVAEVGQDGRKRFRQPDQEVKRG